MNIRNWMYSAASAAAITISVAAVSDAHTIGIGWLDNGDGTVTLFSEHWHGDQTTAYSDNGGLGVYDASGTFLYKTPWLGVINNEDLNADGVARSGDSTPGPASFLLTGYEPDPSNHASSSYNQGTDDWFYSAPLVLGNGTWGFFTGTRCCVDTMSTILYANVTGITSVTPGTGPGGVPAVPLPASGFLLLGGIAGLAALRRRKKEA